MYHLHGLGVISVRSLAVAYFFPDRTGVGGEGDGGDKFLPAVSFAGENDPIATGVNSGIFESE